jgi:nicotinamidase-related amidase
MCNHSNENNNRRDFLKTGLASAAVATAAAVSSPTFAAEDPYAEPAEPGLPPSDMVLDPSRAALVVTDPQIDFLSPDGVTWGVVGESVTQHNTVANIGRLFEAAKAADMTVAISPHYYYPTDKGWKFEGALEKLMHKIGMFDRKSAYTTEGFANSGADFMPEYNKYIHDGKTIVTSPHKVYGPEANDLVLQLRKNRVDQIVLAGMSANLCVESHLRELLEQGFEVAVVKDATAAAKVPEGDGYLAAIINFRFIANAVWTTDEAIKQFSG